jgi:hypothetical protein
MREHAPADAIASFENADAAARTGEIARGRETGHTRTDDDCVIRHGSGIGTPLLCPRLWLEPENGTLMQHALVLRALHDPGAETRGFLLGDDL